MKTMVNNQCVYSKKWLPIELSEIMIPKTKLIEFILISVSSWCSILQRKKKCRHFIFFVNKISFFLLIKFL